MIGHRLRERLASAAPPCPEHLARRHRRIGADGMERIRRALVERYYRSPELFADPQDAVAFLASPEGREDLGHHLEGRLAQDRATVAPWLDGLRPLLGSRILEIGCGTGSSTVALAEQGAEVVGVDLNPAALAVARLRCEVAGLEAELVERNATDLADLLADRPFDLVIFFASLEHMTVPERLLALRGAWDGLAPGAHLAVTDTPNRLWWYDEHTSWAPFFQWLPDELAVRYASRSPRAGFREQFDPGPAPDRAAAKDDAILRLARWGRGVSYHDFEVALDTPADQLAVVSALGRFLGHGRPPRAWLRRLGADGRFEALLATQVPGVDPAFLAPSLDLVLRR